MSGQAAERTTGRRSTLTSGELSELLEVSVRTIHNWAQQRDLPSTATAGGHLRFRPHEVARWLRDSSMDVPRELENAR